MQNYTLGFAFSLYATDVLLLTKNRGICNQSGKLNGIGGKLQESETPLNGMIRESLEEVGLNLNWKPVGELQTRNGIIYLFGIKTDSIYDFQQIESEKPAIYSLLPSDHYYGYETRMPNLDWLIPMIINVLKEKEDVKYFIIKENY